MKRLLGIVFSFALVFSASAETITVTPGSSGGGGGVTGGPFTAGDLVAGNGSSAIQDSSACTPQCVIPNKLELNVGSFTPSSTLPTAGSLGLWVNESVTGTCSASAVSCSYNYFNISSDNAVVGPTSSPFGLGNGWYFSHAFGGAAMTGDRNTMTVNNLLAATSGNTSVGASYTTLAVGGAASANDNGTNTGAGSRGQIAPFEVVAQLLSGATNFTSLQGSEYDIAIATGASAESKIGFHIVQLASDAVQGVTTDAAIVVSNQTGAVGWGTGIDFGGGFGHWPFTSSATAIMCDGACGTLANVLDFHLATITGNVIASPGINIAGPATGSATAPNIDFVTCGTQCGWYSSASGALAMTIGGAVKFEYGIANPGRLTSYVSSQSGNGSGWILPSSAASSTAPTLVPNGAASTTGFGAQAAGNISAIIVATEVARFVAGGLVLPTVATGTPAASLCIDASNNVIKKTTTGSCV